MGTPRDSVAAVVAFAAALAAGCAGGARNVGEAAVDAGAAERAAPRESGVDHAAGEGAPLAGLETRGLDGAALAFVRHCERALLVRAGAAAGAPDGDLRRAWFGGLVQAVPGAEGHGVLALGDVLVETFRAEDADGARALDATLPGASVQDHDWAVARLLALRGAMGAGPFREGLRLLVDRHRGGGPASFRDLAAAMGDIGTPVHRDFASIWLAGPWRPTLRTSWRHDGSRGRLLVRVDQVHGVEDGRPAAYPLELPLRMTMADGTLVDASVTVTERRSLLEVPCANEPLAVTFDPDGTLDGLAALEDEGG